MDAAWILGAFAAAYFIFRYVTRPDPAEQRVLRQLKHVLNDPQFKVKGKYEE